MPYSNSYLDDVLVRMSYHSSGIEGNTITLPETVSIILENALPTGRKSVREFYEIENHKGAFSYLLDLLADKSPLSIDVVLGIHERLTDRLQHDRGQFKTQQSAIIGAEFQTASPSEVYPLMLQWCDNTNWRLEQAQTDQERLEVLADSHIQFERIHPFSDGNGRIGRLLVLYLAMLWLDTPVIVSKDRRADYMENLANQDVTALADMLSQSLQAERERLGMFPQ